MYNVSGGLHLQNKLRARSSTDRSVRPCASDGALPDERLQIHIRHLRRHGLLVVPQRAKRLVPRPACLGALHDVALAHLARALDKLGRARDAQRTVFAERLVEDGCGRRHGGRIVLHEEPDNVVDVLEGLVCALPEVRARRVRGIPNENDPAFVPCLKLGSVVQAILCAVMIERLHTGYVLEVIMYLDYSCSGPDELAGAEGPLGVRASLEGLLTLYVNCAPRLFGLGLRHTDPGVTMSLPVPKHKYQSLTPRTSARQAWSGKAYTSHRRTSSRCAARPSARLV